ncbi:MAG: hypothetical protein ICV67_02100 [Thermoleophilia bacterium]|nr:hypothetical protein [Thermoleophilia bacterium]
MSRCAACVSIGLLLLGACGGDEGLPGGPSSERFELRPAGSVEGAPVGYAEYLPPGYGDGTTRPLLVFWHGVGENGDGSEAALRRLSKLGIPRLIRDGEWPEERPFVVLMPQHDDAPDASCPAARHVDAFVDFALEQYDVDPDRIYLTGISCGAIGVWTIWPLTTTRPSRAPC